MTVRSRESGHSLGPERPLLFISHQRVDQWIADVLREFVDHYSGGRITVYQSSSPFADGTRVGRELQKELKEHLWKSGVIVLVYTDPDEDWSYCIWECGVATHPQSPETKVVVFQCGDRLPSVYRDAMRVNVQAYEDTQRFTNEFLTSPDFFPNYHEPMAPEFLPNGNEVRQIARQLYDAFRPLMGYAEEPAVVTRSVACASGGGLTRLARCVPTAPRGCRRSRPGTHDRAPAA